MSKHVRWMAKESIGSASSTTNHNDVRLKRRIQLTGSARTKLGPKAWIRNKQRLLYIIGTMPPCILAGFLNRGICVSREKPGLGLQLLRAQSGPAVLTGGAGQAHFQPKPRPEAGKRLRKLNASSCGQAVDVFDGSSQKHKPCRRSTTSKSWPTFRACVRD